MYHQVSLPRAGLVVVICIVTLLVGNVRAQEIRLTDGSSIALAGRQTGAQFLRKSDAFTQATGDLERRMRLKSMEAVSEDDLLSHVSEQAADWSDVERMRIRAAIDACHDRLASWKLPFPKTIPLIKTSGVDEGGAAYTRREAVILPQSMLGAGASLEPLLLHELFHVLSRHNPELRRELYAVVGFEPCGQGKLPAQLEQRKVTNPDAPTYDYAVTLEIDGASGKYVPVILLREGEPQRGFNIQSLDFKLMQVKSDGKHWQPALNDEKPVLLPIETPAYQARIGRNTHYIIHPEEVLADNFMLLMRGKMDVPSPEILEKIGAVLHKYAGKRAEVDSSAADR
jgi:hypothetical protein